ncbi:Ti-type conjugative transfer system protein TraG [Allorhizobium ampelinum]|uniref:Ti-type conjugative transfer system protein TraG n=1 Tax=Rhizobium/Agrobacterium group TaxID=227290 RepID=UPI003AB96FF9
MDREELANGFRGHHCSQMQVLNTFMATIWILNSSCASPFMAGIEHWLAAFGKTGQAKLMLGRIGLALPYATAAAIGTLFLFASNGAAGIKAAGWGVVSGSGVAVAIAVLREGVRLSGITGEVPAGQSVFGYADPATMLGASTTFLAGVFALRVAMKSVVWDPNFECSKASSAFVMARKRTVGVAGNTTASRTSSLNPPR